MIFTDILLKYCCQILWSCIFTLYDSLWLSFREFKIYTSTVFP